MQNHENPGTLNQNHQSGTVDLGSNGCRCAHVPWTAPCTRCTGPRWTGRSKRRGMQSKPSARDLKAQDARKRRAAATSPESGGARQGLAGIAPGRRSRPPFSRRAGAKRSGGACARDRGVYGGNCASPAAGTGRGRSDRCGELVSVLLCTKGRISAHSSKEKRASSKVQKMRRRRSLATAAGRVALRCGRGAASTTSRDEKLQQFELDEPLVNPKRRKEGQWRLSFTGGDEITTAAAGTRGGDAGELVLERVRWCAEKAKRGTRVRARA
jgi:hypothetical protein